MPSHTLNNFVNFTTFLTESAIILTSEMKEFSEKALDKLEDLCYRYVTFPLFQREVSGKVIFEEVLYSKYGNYNIKVRIKTPERTTTEAVADVKNKEIIIYIDFENYKHFKKKKSELLKVINHEIIHLVDPKFNKEELLTKNLDKIKKFNLEIRDLYKNGTPEQIDDKINQYVKFPWELDAYISTEADEVFEEIKKKSRSKKDALYYLKNIKPTTPNQKVYKENDKLWKRFILHINKLIERDFRE